MDIEKKVIRTLTDMLGMSDGDVTIDSTKESLNMDSLDDVEFIMAIEEEFDLEIPDEEAERLTTVKQTVECVASMMGGKGNSC